MGARPRILVAEDDQALLEAIALDLEHWGAEVVRARTGAELVLRLAEPETFDLVVSDIYMPWMNGLWAMRSMRCAGLMAPVVFITGASDATLAEQIARLGHDAVLLEKPLDLGRLEAVVGELLNDARGR